MTGSYFKRGQDGYFAQLTLITTLDASRPAGSIPAPTDVSLMSRICPGFQPSSAFFLIACAANFGVDPLKNRSVPAAFSLRICESMVGSETSYDASATIMVAALSPRPDLMPFR